VKPFVATPFSFTSSILGLLVQINPKKELVRINAEDGLGFGGHWPHPKIHITGLMKLETLRHCSSLMI
jgi:hypothetical protein